MEQVSPAAPGQVGKQDCLSCEADLLLWGTGYSVDLSYFEEEEIASIHTLNALVARCGCIFRSLDATNLYFPGVGLDGIGSAPWAYSLLCRSIMSHIRGTAQLDNKVLGHKINHFDIIYYLAPRDSTSYPVDEWRAHCRDIALNTPDRATLLDPLRQDQLTAGAYGQQGRKTSSERENH